jgi:microcystin degradation protein MlrC
MSDRFRIGVGMFHQETNSFNPRPMLAASLDVTSGTDVIMRWRNTGMPLGGALKVLDQPSVELLGLVAVCGVSGGPLEDRAFKDLSDRFLSESCRIHLDAVYLDLHGALMSESSADVTGSLLRKLRQVLPPGTLIGVSLDSHANITEAIVSSVDVLVGFKTYPHQDYAATGAQAAKLILRALSGEIRPIIRVAKIPMIQPPETSSTFEGPMADLVEDLNRRRQKSEILDGTFFYAQPWLDNPLHGSAVTVTTDNDPDLAEKLVRHAAEAWWRKRAEFTPTLLSPREAINRALKHPSPSVMLSEAADAINSGAVGDNPTLIRELVETPDLPSALTFTCDPVLVGKIDRCPDGSKVQVTFGEETDRRFASPFSCHALIERRAAGRFRLEGTYFNGLEQDMGGAVVLQIGKTRILVARCPVFCSEPALYRCAGLEPSEYKMIGIKSPASFRPNFLSISSFAFMVDVRGASSANLPSLPWKAVRRPLYPLDQSTPYEIDIWAGPNDRRFTATTTQVSSKS